MKGIARIERRAVELIKTVIVDRLAVDILSFRPKLTRFTRENSEVDSETSSRWDCLDSS